MQDLARVTSSRRLKSSRVFVSSISAVVVAKEGSVAMPIKPQSPTVFRSILGSKKAAAVLNCDGDVTFVSTERESSGVLLISGERLKIS